MEGTVLVMNLYGDQSLMLFKQRTKLGRTESNQKTPH